MYIQLLVHLEQLHFPFNLTIDEQFDCCFIYSPDTLSDERSLEPCVCYFTTGQRCAIQRYKLGDKCCEEKFWRQNIQPLLISRVHIERESSSGRELANSILADHFGFRVVLSPSFCLFWLVARHFNDRSKAGLFASSLGSSIQFVQPRLVIRK